MKRYHVHVCLNVISIFVENWRRWCEIRPSVRPPRALPRTLGESKILATKSSNYRPNVRRAQYQQDIY